MADPPGWYATLMERCPPLSHTVPDWGCAETLRNYQRFCVTADLLGLALMPWQRLVLAQLAMPRIFELVLVVGRQQGKTSVLTVPLVDALIHRPGHTAVYSAQGGTDADRKVRQEMWPLMRRAGLDETLGWKFIDGPQNFGVHNLASYARLRTITRGKDSLRGETNVAVGVLDEARADKDHNRTALLTPTMTAVADPKLVLSSTAGHAGSVMLRDTLDRAREQIGNADGVTALCEWGLEPDTDHDPADPTVWHRTLPALGYTVEPKAIERAHLTMEPAYFEMEYLGIWLGAPVDVAVPDEIWLRSCRSDLELRGDTVLGVDVTPELDRAAAAACDASGAVRLVGVREAGEDLHDWVTAMTAATPGVTQIVMPNAPGLRRTGERLRMAGHRVNLVSTAQMQEAAARFWDALHFDGDPKILIVRHPALDAANRGSFRRMMTAGWVFNRQSKFDFSCPLIAATLAYDTARRPSDVPEPDVDLNDYWDRLVSGSSSNAGW